MRKYGEKDILSTLLETFAFMDWRRYNIYAFFKERRWSKAPSFLKQSLLFFLFFILIGFGYLATFKSLDPDFGWHLRTGELILEKGVPKTDWYSFTMPDFPWIAHSWLTDVFIYKIYSTFGFQTLLIFFLVITSLSFIILVQQKIFLFYFLPVILGFWAVLGFLGVRPQIVTLLFVAVLWKILSRFLEKEQFSLSIIFYLPILFLTWVNLHGGFFAGLLILFLVFILEIFKKTSLFKKMLNLRLFQGQNYQEQSLNKILIIFILLIFSFFATLMNPYGIRIYEEIFLRTSGDNFLRFHIVEWFPLLFASPPIFTILYLSLILGLLIPLRREIEFSQLVLALTFLFFALLNQRHFPLFVVLSIPIFAQLIFHLREIIVPERWNILFGGFRKWFAVLILLILLAWGFYPYLVYAFKSDPSFYYPEKALPFLKTLPLSENLFNEYDWGGYLIWKLPERKLFIDGRMPSWRDNSQFVFGDYFKIMSTEEGFEELLDKYEIKIALLKNKITKLNKQDKTENKIIHFLKRQKWLLKILGLKSRKSLAEELISRNWQIIYQDEVAIILRR